MKVQLHELVTLLQTLLQILEDDTLHIKITQRNTMNIKGYSDNADLCKL